VSRNLPRCERLSRRLFYVSGIPETWKSVCETERNEQKHTGRFPEMRIVSVRTEREQETILNCLNAVNSFNYSISALRFDRRVSGPPI
jgi:hypothetical protein